MNKWQIICPLALLALVAAIGLVFVAYLNQPWAVAGNTQVIGEDLLSTGGSARLLEPDSTFQNRLSNFLILPVGVASMELGDELPPLGDGSACSRLLLTNAHGGMLAIRLAKAPKGKFRILSHSTPTEGSRPD